MSDERVFVHWVDRSQKGRSALRPYSQKRLFDRLILSRQNRNLV